MASRCNDDTPIISKVISNEIRRTGPLEHLAFSMLKSNKDRYMYAYRRVPNLNYIFPEVQSTAKKCLLTAETLKTEGNNAFGLRQYEKAQELFTLSAAYAVPDHLDGSGKNTLALSIANRSGALFYLGMYKESLIDIENALQMDYPEDLKFKLYNRKGKCYQALKSYKAAELEFVVAVTLLNKATISEVSKKGTLKQIQNNIEVCVRNRAASIEVNLDLKGELPKLSDEPNATHPSLSSACEVEYRPGKGRCVVAARDIKPGEVLLVEKPYASIFVADEQYKDSCHHCFYPCITLLPCLKCSRARYCSFDCRDLAWETYHKYECGIRLDDLIGEGSSGHLALRIILVAGLDRLLQSLQNQSPAAGEEEIAKTFTGCNEGGQYLSSDYTPVHHLHAFDNVPKEHHITMAFGSVFLTKLLEKMKFFDNTSAEIKETAMACVGECLIPHLIPVVPSSLHICHNVPEEHGPEVRIPVGPSLASTYSLFNHSCDAETCEAFYGNNVVVHSLQSFKQGQEVTINYGEPYVNSGKEIRQSFLQGISFFDCACEPCLQNWPLLSDMSNKATFKCTQCEAPLDKPEMDFFQCQNCELVQSVKAKRDSLKSASKLLEIANQCEGIRLQLEYMAAIDKLLVQPWRDYVGCKGSVMNFFRQNGSFLIKQYRE